MNNEEPLYFRCIKSAKNLPREFVVGDVYPGWRDNDGDLVVALSEHSTRSFDSGDKAVFKECFEPVGVVEFEGSIQAAIRGVDDVRRQQGDLMKELSGFSSTLLGAGEMTAPAGEGVPSTTTAIQVVNPASQLRNRAHSLKRKASDLAAMVKEKKELLDAKLGQKLAMAMASLGDMQAVIKKLEEVVFTVQLYLGRDEEVICLRDGEPAPAATPLCIRQNVLFMDEEIALEQSHGIDFEEIGAFDQWLLENAANLSQVIPEPKGVVVLQVRRNKKKYEGETLADAIENAAKDGENLKSYWLLKNGERLHRIHANIHVGDRLIPRHDEVEHFFFERSFARHASEPVPLRPGSRAFIEAMERADAVRRHYMRLALVLQGLIDRTQLFAPYKDNIRPNLLDPLSTDGNVHFLRDVEGTITDGRPSFSDWLSEINAGLQHGHRIVGSFPTHFSKDDENRISPKHARGVDDEIAQVALERRGELYFLFKRTDTVYRRGYGSSSGEAKTAASYRIYRSDKFFICIDAGASVEDMEYYLNDRRHRSEYENMVPCLKSAITFKRAETEAERPFRDLLLRKLSDASLNNPCSPEQLDRLILWYKTKTKEHRALLSDDAKAYRMILDRHVAQAAGPTGEQDRQAVLEMISRMSDVIYAFHFGGRDYGVLRIVDGERNFLKEETWRVTRGTAHCVETKPFVLAQKAHYNAFPSIYSSKAWDERPASYSPAKHLSPAFYPLLIEWVKANPWFGCGRNANATDERLVAIYITPTAKSTSIRAASIELSPETSRGWGSSRSKGKASQLDRVPLPDGHERKISFVGIKSPKFEYRFDYGTSTHISHDGEITLGWVSKNGDGNEILLFVDEQVLVEARKLIAVRRRHNVRADRLNGWIRRASQSAKTHFEDSWKAKHFAKYNEEGGDLEFFEDHLKTLPKEIPETDFVYEILHRALSGGRKPAELAGMSLAEIAAEYPPQSKATDDDFFAKDDPDVPTDLVTQLTEGKWRPPAPDKDSDDNA